MDAQGNRAGASNVIISALHQRFDGGFNDAMSGSAKAITSIGAAWDNMLDKLRIPALSRRRATRLLE